MPHVVSGPQRAQVGKCEAIHHLVGQTKFASRLDMIDVPFAVVVQDIPGKNCALMWRLNPL
jgi:hypothetical protein